MKLARCTECSRIIDLDELEELGGNEVIGCGLKEGDYKPCADCSERTRLYGCRDLRHDCGWTKTTVADMEDSV